MIDRVTFHVRDGIAVTGVGKIYDPAKRKTRTMAGAVIRLSEYEDTGLDPWEIRRLKAERDAAVKDLEALMSKISSADACGYCERDGNGCHSNFGATSCRPKWRGPQQEPHWIDNADSYVCSSCGYECNNPNLLKDGPSVCPNCKRQMKATYGPQQEET